MSDESSTYSGAASYSAATRSTRFHLLSSLRRPLRRSSPLIAAWDAMKRCASSASDISRLNSATGRGRSLLSATFSAMFVTSADLPMDGRAASTMRLPGWKPPVIASRSPKPDGVPVRLWPSAESFCHLPISACSTSPTCRKSFWRSSCATSRIVRSARSLRARGSASGPGGPAPRLVLVAVDAGLDVVRRGEESAQQRPLLHDPPVVAERADRRRGGGQRVDLRLAARLIELAARAQLLRDGEDVDRLARGEQGEHGLEDGPMALAVEVLRAQALLDHVRVVRAVGLQDRAQDRLLGLDGVGRNGAGGRAGAMAVGDGRCAHRVTSE